RGRSRAGACESRFVSSTTCLAESATWRRTGLATPACRLSANSCRSSSQILDEITCVATLRIHGLRGTLMPVQPQPADVLPGAPRRWRPIGGQAPTRRRQRGFTLVELMVTVAVAAVLLMIAVPSFRNITLSNRLNTAANDLVNAISVARMEAVKRNASTQFCSNSASVNTSETLGSACGTETGAVWAMRGGAASQVLAGAVSLAEPVRINGDVTALQFTAQGQARKAGTSSPFNDLVADICTSQMSSDNHRRITMTAGSILATTTTSGDCP